MSFSVWPVTFRLNRVDTFPDTPVGSDCLSGALGRDDEHDTERGPDLDDELRIRPGGLAMGRVGEQVLRLIDDAHDRPQLEGPFGGDLAGGALVWAHRTVERLQSLGTAHDLGAEQPQRLGGVADGFVVDAGDEPVTDTLEGVEVAAALEFVHPHLRQGIQRDGAREGADGGGLALPGDRPDQPVVVSEGHLHDPAAHISTEWHRGEHVGLAAA
jgi:hypothetical protein